MVFLFLFSDFMSEEMDYIEKGLYLLNIEKKEVSYEKKLKKRDTFRLKRVEELMDRPLRVPFYAETTATFFKKNNIKKTLSYIAKELDVFFKEENISSSAEIKNFIKKNVEKSARMVLKAFEKLTEEQKDSLLYTLPYLWTDEDDSTDDYFLGIIHKEFGVERDTSYKLDGIAFLKIAEKIDFSYIFKGSLVLYSLMEEIKNYKGYLASLPDTFIDGVLGPVKKIIHTAYGDVVIGGGKDNIYIKDFMGIIDIGGDDRYENRGGGAIGFLLFPVSFVVDFSGNDMYVSSKVSSQGAGIAGIGILLDEEGNDFYQGGSYSQGAGIAGIGILVDKKGDDTYRAGFFVQGAGNFGAGILTDIKGEDVYTAWDFAQGFGSVKGYGLLFDSTGEDIYYAGGRYIHHPLLPYDYRSFAQGFSIGWRDIASGGIGFLLDEEGNDKYTAEVYAQGSSYWFSAGFLVDKKGNDVYTASEYAQGAGIHLSVGCLLDFEGDDHYYSKYGPSQGEGHDLAVGWLWDGDGDDVYYTSGGHGIGLTNSVGIFIDRRGKDVYSKREKIGEGDATWARGFGGLGIFLDLEGKDYYPDDEKTGNDKIWFKGKRSVGMDIEAVPPKKEPWYDTLAKFPELDTLSVEEKIKKLFEYASMWEVREAIGKVRTARKMLAKYGKKALSYVFENEFKTYDGLKLRAIKDLAKRMPDSTKPYLYKYLDAENDTLRRNAVWLLGELKDTSAGEKLIAMLDKPENKELRGSIIISLGKIKDKKATDKIIKYLKDKKEIIRIKAAEALGRIKDKRAIQPLLDAMKDEFFTVRDACIAAISKFGEEAVEEVFKRIENKKDKEVVEFIILLQEIYKNMKEKERKNLKKRYEKIVEKYRETTYLPLKRAIAQLADVVGCKGKLPIEALIKTY